MAHLRVAFDGEQAVAILARAGREGAGPVVHAVEGVAGARAASDALHEPAPPAGRREEHVLPLQEKEFWWPPWPAATSLQSLISG